MKTLITLSSILAAGTLAVNAATLLGSWDFSTAVKKTDGSISATSGTLTMNTYGQALEDGVLKFSSDADTGYANISGLSTKQIGPASGNDDRAFTIVLTITSLTVPSSGTSILWSTKDSANGYRTGIGLNTSSNLLTLWQGSSSGRPTASISSYLSGISSSSPLTIRASYSDVGCKIYFNDTSIIDDGSLKWSGNNYLTDMYLGNWSSGQENGVATMNVSSFSVYKGIYVPEPSAFGLLAGIGALALAGTRRRRKVK